MTLKIAQLLLRNLINLLRERAIGYLKAEKLTSESIIESTLRPKGVLIKYKELIREAARDEQTLIQLEDQFNLFKLDLAAISKALTTSSTYVKSRIILPLLKTLIGRSLIIASVNKNKAISGLPHGPYTVKNLKPVVGRP